VLSWSEARAHPHSAERRAYVKLANVEQPAPAPRFSRSAPGLKRAPPERGEGGGAALAEWGFNDEQIERLRRLGTNFRV
jgi:alpha-methylacyl-CoA racemase